MSSTRGVLGALVVAGVVGAASTVHDASTEGTVVGKADEGVYDYACDAGGTMTGPVAVPIWAVCSAPKCRRLIVRNSDGRISKPCVSLNEFDRTELGSFWHEQTDH